MGYLEAICKIGPRISGTDGMKQQQELVKKHFEAHGARLISSALPPISSARSSRWKWRT